MMETLRSFKRLSKVFLHSGNKLSGFADLIVVYKNFTTTCG